MVAVAGDLLKPSFKEKGEYCLYHNPRVDLNSINKFYIKLSKKIAKKPGEGFY